MLSQEEEKYIEKILKRIDLESFLSEQEQETIKPYAILALAFFKRISDRGYAKAYDLTSMYLKEKVDLERFTHIHQGAWKLYGNFQNINDVSWYSPNQLEEMIFPSYIPHQDRRANILITLTSYQSNHMYDLWVAISEEADNNVIAAFDYRPSD